MKHFIIHRYLCREIFYPFLLVLLVLTFVLLMGRILQLMDLMINKGVGFPDILRLILFLLPPFLAITVPIALLVGILIGLGRLSRENEILVMKSAGISLYQLVPPVALLSLAAFALTLLLQFYIVPVVNSAGRLLLVDLARQKAGIGIKEKVFNDDFPGLVLYANRVSVDGSTMSEIFISDSRTAGSPLTIVAQLGRLITDPASGNVTLRLEDGSTHMTGADLSTYRKMDFGIYDISLEMSTSLQASAGDHRLNEGEMTPRRLLRELSSADLSTRQRNLILMELNKRFALPLTCLVFALLGLPLGMVKHRTAKSRAFVVALGVVIVYYALQLGGDALGETGKLNPVLATWSPNLVLGTAGAWFFIMTARELPLPDLNRLKSATVGVMDALRRRS